jgi:YjbE family integral membrane protein
MDGAAAASSFGVLLQILFLDLLLSGDNALVIALACRRLPPEQARRAAWMGAAGAILFRLILTLMTGALMRLPFLQLLSAFPLLVIAINLMQDEGNDEHALVSPQAAQSGILAAAGIIVVSDAAMSLDNVLALAAVSGGSFWLLAFGLALTIPLIIFGSFGFSRLMLAFPLLVDAGSALLGWVAGGMIVSDPLFSAWAANQAPAVGLALPLACAIFVLAQGRFARQREKAAPWVEKIVAAPLAKVEKPVEKAAPPVIVGVAAEQTPATEEGTGDRWMVVGLVALFLVFGVFLTVAVMISD